MARRGGFLPDLAELRRFLADQPGRLGKREISRAFGLGPEHRAGLRDLLRALAEEGEIAPAGARRYRAPGRLPEILPVEVISLDRDGEAVARPLDWTADGPAPAILMAPEPRGRPALALGARVLARLRPIAHGRYEGRTVKRLSDRQGRILGVFRASVAASPHPDAGRIVPADRRARAEWRVPPGESGGAEPGEIVEAIPLPTLGYGLKPARVIARLGREGEARAVSLLAIAAHDIPVDFSEAALAEAARAGAVPLAAREDLRAVPLITIDGPDARDFDDAVFAEPVIGGGFRLIVAIADVAHYVRPGSALDQAARTRGNSVYFPDRVVPMLPEALSAGWCSLRPGEPRGCLFVEMRIAANGETLSHRFGRGLMQSHARLTYDEVEDAHQSGQMASLLDPLYGAFRALQAQRMARGALDLDLPEQVVTLDAAGRIASIRPRVRRDSHRLIEEFMVLANVAAAETLEARRVPCLFRVHAPPAPEKLVALRDMLAGFGIRLAPGDRLHPRDLGAVLDRITGRPEAPLVNETMLRSLSQAAYSPENIGHFGLALARYAHFTSPIRRYADLLVHRALIHALHLGPDGLQPDEVASLEDVASHITATERRAAAAERAAIERYLAAFLADRIGENFAARISGVTRAVLFVTLLETGASGIVPLSSLPDDEWMFDFGSQMLSGRRRRISYRLAQAVTVRLIEANPLTGGMIFHILDETSGTPATRPRLAGKRAAKTKRPSSSRRT
ncbi:ribonuclease R [Acidibrevibacterium fodinaquatile]|uniref:ribonuclease R n=1 Tax=Acidibrevibacterium fodinaquatile TaxID=1969806 RepID=UPI001F075709|nr:ribonuclease R [Acidibrevibacterium fodinaquatile]